MRRRQFFKNTLPVIALPHLITNTNSALLNADLSDVYTKSDLYENDKVLVYVNLSGGLDALDLLFPINKHEFIAECRPSLVFPKDEYLELNSEFGMHPSLEKLARLFYDSKLDVYTNLGSEDSELLHSIALNESLLLEGESTWLDRFASKYIVGDPVIKGINCSNGFVKKTSNYDYVELPDLTINSQLEFIIHELKKGTASKVFVLNVSGFDTHENQKFKLSDLYASVSEAVYAFQLELNNLGLEERVSTLLFSEMGRSIQENSTLGTEHGKGGSAILIGNGARGFIHNSNTLMPWVDFYAELFDRINISKNDTLLIS